MVATSLACVACAAAVVVAIAAVPAAITSSQHITRASGSEGALVVVVVVVEGAAAAAGKHCAAAVATASALPHITRMNFKRGASGYAGVQGEGGGMRSALLSQQQCTCIWLLLPRHAGLTPRQSKPHHSLQLWRNRSYINQRMPTIPFPHGTTTSHTSHKTRAAPTRAPGSTQAPACAALPRHPPPAPHTARAG